MSGDQLANRLLSAEANVNSTRLRFGAHSETEEARIMHSMGILGEASIFIDDSPMLNVPEIRAKLKRLQGDHGLDLVIIDYLQLLHGTKNQEALNKMLMLFSLFIARMFILSLKIGKRKILKNQIINIRLI